LVLICYADIVEHAKVPEIEQLVSVGCAINNFSLALYGHGFGSVWRTGDPAYSVSVHKALGFRDKQKIVGFLYIGTPSSEDKTVPLLNKDDYVTTYTQWEHRSG
jgi:nitroreductase